MTTGEHSHCGCGSAKQEHDIPQGAHQLRVSGMDCASCAATIASAVQTLPGVSHAHVSLGREMLSFDLEPGKTDLAKVAQTVTDLGFGTARMDAPKELARWWENQKLRHLGLALLVSAAALGGARLLPGLEFVLLSVAVLFALYPVALRAFAAARLGTVFTIQMLMTIAAIGAVLIGEQLEALLVVFLFTLGELLEGLAAHKARSGIKALGALMPKTALLLENDTPREVPADSLRIGQTVLVRPGDRVPADGDIIDGMASLDESPVTGESIPVSKAPGAPVFAGTVAHDAAFQLRVTREAEDNTIARIIAMVEEAQDAKAPTERFIERFSKIYMPIILGIAILVAILPPLAGLGTWETWTYRALALLLIGCPCALVISVPAAVAASLAAGARHGLLVKGGAVLEELARTRTVVFDKTGTLTEGSPRVTDVIALTGTPDALLALASGVEQGSSHPLAQAICDEAQARDITAEAATQTRIVPGKGMEAQVHGQDVFIGAPRFALERADLDAKSAAQIAQLERAGKTVVVVIAGAQLLGLFALRDEPRASTRTGLAELQAQGVETVMMTGDNRHTARAVGDALGLRTMAEMLPEDKASEIRKLARQHSVMMVGDGVNDAPALAEAQIGVAIGSGTDVALEAADAALMRNDIRDVARLTRLARRTMNIVRQNVAIAIGLKAVFLVTTVTGLSGLWMAVLADTGATVLVTLNAMRLLGALGRKPAPVAQPSAPGMPETIRP